jgi:hypothetical protein
VRPENHNEEFLKNKIGPTIDKWETDGKSHVDLSYWIERDKKRVRVRIIASTLDEAIDFAQAQEERLKCG